MSVKVKISEIPDAENLQDFYTIGTKYNDDGSKESVKMPLQFLEEGEDARRAAEEKRIEAEKAREAAEGKRASAENTRQSNEEARQSAESARASAENTRKSNEATRQSNEAARQSAESKRASAESDRETAEVARATAEKARAAAEGTRTANEETRQSAEAARQSAEDTRKSAEEARQSAENARLGAETKRETAENDRVKAETARETASGEAVKKANDAAAKATDAATAANNAASHANTVADSLSEEMDALSEELAKKADKSAITPDTTYTFENGTDGSFKVTPKGGSAQTVSIGKPATAGTADKVVITSIPENADLNDYTTVGDYRCGADAYVRTLKNCPVIYAFFMTVRQATTGAIQTLVTYLDNSNRKIYQRSLYLTDGVWSDWVRIYTTIDPPAFSEVKSRPTTLGGYGITDAKIAGGVITLGENTITPLTSHQDLSGYAKKTDIPTIPNLSGGSGAEDGKYVSGVTVSGHTVTVTKANLPAIPTALKNPAALKAGSKSYDGSTEVTLTAGDLGAAAAGHTHSYSDLTNRPTIPGPATQSADGLMSATDKKKLDGMNIWTGTESEYDALGSKSATTLYFIRKS